MNAKGFIVSALCATGVFLLLTDNAQAVPAFSRAYKVECTTCHTIYPELNEYGEAFLKNSYVYVGKSSKTAKKIGTAPAPIPVAKPETPVGEAPKVMGAGDSAKLNKLKAGALGAGESAQTTSPEPAVTVAEPADSQSEGMILAGIPELLPISFTGSINYFTGDRRNIVGGNELDFAARSFKLHAAGNFRDTIGFFGTYVAYAEGAGNANTSSTPSNAGSNINEFFLQWRNLLGTPVNLKAGRMQPKLGLWKTNNKLSVTNNYVPYSYTVGQQSEFRIEQPQDALELNSILGNRLFVAAGIVNRKGQNEKDGYGHVSYKFGGADYLGNEPNVDLDKEEQILDFLTLTAGAYGYYGQNGKTNSNDPKNTYFRAGLDTELLYKIYRLRMLANIGEDDNVSLSINPWTKVISKAATFEGEITLLVNLIAAARFEYLQQESAGASFKNVYSRRYIATLGYAPLENFKLSTEFKYEIGQTDINRIGTLGATFSF
ncbi:MAG: hypothetical protein H7X83_07035 [Verrucomicrobia bacterium]|nr:hypothetical protein [Deltaproteobacteria bacterium]